MERLLGNLLSWSISVVVVGILINIASHYLLKRLDTTLSRFSSRHRERQKIEIAQRLGEIDWLRNSPHAQVMASFRVADLELFKTRNYMLAWITLMSYLVASVVDPILPSGKHAWVFGVFTVMFLTSFLLTIGTGWKLESEKSILRESFRAASSEEIDDGQSV